MSLTALVRWIAVCLIGEFCFSLDVALADRFVHLDKDGRPAKIELRLVQATPDAVLLELADGQYTLLPRKEIRHYEKGEGPEPQESGDVLAALEERFGSDRFVSLVQPPYAMGLVLWAPLPRNSAAGAKNVLKKVATFMHNVDVSFSQFARDVGVHAGTPKYPLVVLVFENKADFREFVGRGKRAALLAGCYNQRTNYLVVKLEECRSFDTVLHEAIHQLSWNRNMLQRLAPVPKWFSEGIATGFEASKGKVALGPTKISQRYTERARKATALSWKRMLVDDSLFQGDDEETLETAYANAWALHWLLVTDYKKRYPIYLHCLSRKKPLEEYTPRERLKDVEEAFGKDIDQLHAEFLAAAERGLKQQKDARKAETPGHGVFTEALGEAKLHVVRDGAGLGAEGALTNISPLRSYSFRVVLHHASGQSMEWLAPNLGSLKSTPLKPQSVMIPVSGGPRLRTYRVHIESVLPGDEQTFQAGSDLQGKEKE